MAEKYIRQNTSSYSIVKGSKTFAKITGIDDAIFIRDLLIGLEWNLDKVPSTAKKDDNYLVLAVVDEKLHLLAKYKTQPNSDQIQRLTKKFIRNPNNSKYGLNITRVHDTFAIKKQIAGDDYIFGYYDNLEDAQFVRNFLLDNDWNINAFNEIEFDDEAGNYKIVNVIDDNAYIIDTYGSRDEIDLEKSYGKFLAKLSKHKYGFSRHPHLDLLKERIPDLEKKFQVSAKDDIWSFENIDDSKSVLSQVIFNLTPFEQSVYDAIGTDTTLEEIELSLIRYKSKNFTQKISKNIDELLELNLIEKTGENTFSKTKK